MAYAVGVVKNPLLWSRALIIPTTWIRELVADPTMVNLGLNRNRIFTIFYSTHEETEPNFTLEVRDVFEEENRLDALYAARIIRFFGN